MYVSQKIPVGDLPPTPPHFAAFIEQAWKPARKELSNPSWSIPEIWLPVWNEEKLKNLERCLETHLEEHKWKNMMRSNLFYMLISAIIGSIIGSMVTVLLVLL